MANEREIQLLIKAKDEAHGVLSGHMAKLDELTQKHLGLSLKATAAYAAIAAGAITAAKEVYQFVDRMAELGDAADEMSQRTNMSVESLSRWGYVLGKEGASLQKFEGATRRLARAMYEAQQGGKEQQQAFAALGVQYENADGSLVSVEEAMLRVSDGLKGTADETKRTALMTELLGRGSGSLAVVMNQGSEAIRGQMKELQDLGGEMSGGFAKSSAAFEDSQARLKAAWDGLKMSMAQPLMEPLANATDNLAKATAGLNKQLERQLSLRISLAAMLGPYASMFVGGVAQGPTSPAPGFGTPDYMTPQQMAAASVPVAGPARWSQLGGAAPDDFELGNLLSGADDINAVLKEASTHSIVLKDTIAEVGDTGQQSAQMIGQAMASALEQAIFEARDLDDILGGLARTFISLGLSAVLTPGAGFLGLEQGGGIPRAAYGMSVRGGIPGMDSVPIMAQAGEEVLDRTLSYELRNFLAQVQGGGVAATGAARVAGPVSITQQFAFPVRESERRAVGRHARIAVQEAGRDYL